MKKSKTYCKAKEPGIAGPQSRTVSVRSSLAGTPRLSFVAMAIALCVVIARSTMLETLRDPFGLTPQSHPYPRGEGPASALVLDLLTCVPALLVLLDRVLHKQATVRRSVACAISFLLSIWILLSTFWADDKFAALVMGAHFAAALGLLWSLTQTVTNWRRFRLVAAVCHGLLLVNLTQASLYKFVDLPDMQKDVDSHKAEFLKERGWKADEFLARQFLTKIENGELFGFTSSSNSCAAMLVMLAGVSVGLAIQRLADDGAKSAGWAILIAAAIPVTAWVLTLTLCKAALFTSALTILMLALLWRCRSFLARKSQLAYGTGASLILLAAIAVVGFGLIFNRLPGASLNFRWRYWVASWQMVLNHPIIGVGWDNFGLHYLRYRLPIAAEEIQDPHNFPLRFLTELGIIGAALAMAWLARLWWELTRPVWNADDKGERIGPIWIILISLAGLAINALTSVDYAQSGWYVAYQLMVIALFALVLIFGASVAAMKSLADPTLDERPAPWVLYAALVSVAAFLIHNTIEFSLFETEPLMLMVLLAGSVLGIRGIPTPARRGSAVVTLCVSCGLWLAAVAGLAFPTAQAEGLAHQGDSEFFAQNYGPASDDYLAAFHADGGLNADYAYRASLALNYNSGREITAVRQLLVTAIAADRSMALYQLSMGRVDASLGDAGAASNDYQRALDLDPNEVSIRLEYAAVLMHFGRSEESARQCQLAAHYNDLLPAEEPKRMSDADLQRQIDAIQHMPR
jgi:O-antigen ligase